MCNPNWKKEAIKLRAELQVANNKIAELEAKPWSRYPPVSGQEIPSPQGWIDFEDIEFSPSNNKATLNLKDISFGILTDSNSMDGLMDVNHILIEEKDFDKGLLKPGDIITYLASNDHHYIHQIIDIVVEDGERIYTLQGTNNATPDIDRVTNDMIESVVAAIIYARERINQ